MKVYCKESGYKSLYLCYPPHEERSKYLAGCKERKDIQFVLFLGLCLIMLLISLYVMKSENRKNTGYSKIDTSPHN